MLLAFVGLKWGCERSLTEAGPWERQHTLHHPCHMLASCPSDCALNCAMWLLQTKEQLSRLSFWQQWVGSRAASLSAVHRRKMWPSTHQFCNMLASCPFLGCSYGKQHLSHAEKQSVWSRSCGLQDFFLVAQCCPFALFGCIPLFAWTRLNFIAG